MILYKHANYDCGGEGEGSGYVQRTSTGWQNVPGSFNDQASSIRIPSGWSVKLYEHSDRGGASVCRNSDDNDFAGDTFDNGVGLNDQVSSFEVFDNSNCGSPPPTCNTPSPSSPCNGVKINQTSNVNFSWSGNCSQYYAEYWGDPAGTIGSGWVGSTSWNPGQLWCGSYSWHVKGKSSGGVETGWSSECYFTVVPNTPTGLAASAASSSQINLSWNDPGGEKDGYKVYYSNSNYIGSTGSTSYQVTGLNCNTSYCFYVTAYKGSLESDHSNEACATTQSCPPVDTTPPVVNWTQPTTNGQVYPVGNIVIQLEANATDNVGVVRVEFWRWDAAHFPLERPFVSSTTG